MTHYRFHDLFKIRRVNFSFNAQTLLQLPKLIQKNTAIYSKSNEFVLKDRDRLQIPGLIKELQRHLFKIGELLFKNGTVPPLFSGRIESRIDIKTQCQFIIAFMIFSKSEE